LRRGLVSNAQLQNSRIGLRSPQAFRVENFLLNPSALRFPMFRCFIRTIVFSGVAFAVIGSTWAQRQRMTPELLWQLGRLGATSLSADGARVAYTVRHYDLASNRGHSSLHVCDLSAQTTEALAENWRSVADVQFAPASGGDGVGCTLSDYRQPIRNRLRAIRKSTLGDWAKRNHSASRSSREAWPT
jgi:hypothetical protein